MNEWHSEFRVGPWLVEPSRNLLSRNGLNRKLEPRVMDLLVYLARHAGEVVTRETILSQVWDGLLVADTSLNWSVAQLRKALGCKARRPSFIETVPKRGYRLIALVNGFENPSTNPTFSPTMPPQAPGNNPKLHKKRRPPGLMFLAGMLSLLAAALVLFMSRNPEHGAPALGESVSLMDADGSGFAGGPDSKVKMLPRNLSAHDLYLLGRHHMNRRSDDSLKRAVELFHMAIDQDATFPLSYAGLSNAYGLMAVWGNLSFEDVAAPRREAIKKALALDNRSAEAHIALGGLHYHHGRYENAIAAYEKGLELDPDHVTGHQWLGDAQRAIGRFRQAGRSHQRARQLAPLSPIVNLDLGCSLHLLGFHEESLRYMEQAAALDKDFAAAYQHIARAHRDLGRLDQAIVWLRRAHELEPARVEPLIWMGEILLDLDRPGRARAYLAKLESIDPHNGRTRFFRYKCQVAIGEGERARSTASRAAKKVGDTGSLLDLAYLEYLAGDYAAALSTFQKVPSQAYLLPDSPVRLCNWHNMVRVGFLRMQTGEPESGRALLNKVASFVQQSRGAGYRLPHGYYMEAAVASALGERRKATRALRLAVSEGWRGWWVMRHEAYWNPNRQDPSFAAILADCQARNHAMGSRVRAL